MTQERSRDEIIYGQVFDAILEQRLAPGTRLSEDKLGQLFGVSRTIVRKVLQRLEHEGVVEIHRNRGASVASTTAQQARQAFVARRAVEQAIIECACARIAPEQIAGLRELIADEQDAVSRQDKGRALRLSGELHLQLADACGNEFLAGFARSLVSRCSLIIAQYETSSGELCSTDEHANIIDAIAARDQVLAVQLMNEHICHIEGKLNLDEDVAAVNLADIFLVKAG